ncbi:hypothetical protein N7528_004580 [Penicillium herquei]|nr:hypothetical protein N7528_004580 [Penicillium herquei]
MTSHQRTWNSYVPGESHETTGIENEDEDEDDCICHAPQPDETTMQSADSAQRKCPPSGILA